MRRIWIAVGVALSVLFVAFIGYRVVVTAQSRQAPAEKRTDAPLVETTRATRRSLSETLSLTGTVRPRNEVDIFAKVSGRVEWVGPQVGDRVKAGQALVTIEHREVAWQSRAAAAAEQVAKANLEGAKLELQRAEVLFKGGAASQAQLDSARVKFQLTQAQHAQAQAAAGLAEQQLANSRVDSPIAGTVTRRPVNVGNNVVANTVLCTVQDVATLKLETSIDGASFARLSRGSAVQVRVDAYPGEVFPGSLTLLSPALDAQTRRAAAEVEVDNSSRKLLPNMFARATAKLGELKDVVAVPREAVLEAPGGAVIFRIQDGVAHFVKPRLGPEDSGWIAVLSGLSEGDEVATTGLGNLADGVAVRTAPSTISGVSKNEARTR